MGEKDEKAEKARMTGLARSKGMTPGTRVACAADGTPGTVADESEWRMAVLSKDAVSLIGGKDDSGNPLYLFSARARRWAAPLGKPVTEGLEHGTVCDPDPPIRRAILAKALETGLVQEGAARFYEVGGIGYDVGCAVLQSLRFRGHRFRAVPPGEFYDRLCNTRALVPPDAKADPASLEEVRGLLNRALELLGQKKGGS